MFDSLGSFLQTASAVLVVTSLAGLGLMRATVVNLRESLADLRSEVADKDRQNADLKAETARQGSDLDALKRVVTGEAHWVAIGQKIDAHDAAARSHWSADEELLGLILQTMRARGES